MTEEQWATCTDKPLLMLAYLRARPVGWRRRLLGLLGVRPDRRKDLLFVCACCEAALTAGDDPAVLRVAERYADGLATAEEMKAAAAAGGEAGRPFLYVDEPGWKPGGPATWAARRARLAAASGARSRKAGQAAAAAQRRRQCELLRDIFGPHPHRPTPTDPAWLRWGGGTVAKMAGAIYREGRFEELPVLADALEEAGCTDGEVLGHLRGPGPHVKGCHLVDAILGRS